MNDVDAGRVGDPLVLGVEGFAEEDDVDRALAVRQEEHEEGLAEVADVRRHRDDDEGHHPDVGVVRGERARDRRYVRRVGRYPDVRLVDYAAVGLKIIKVSS